MPSRLVIDGTMRRLTTSAHEADALPRSLSNAETFFRYVMSRAGLSENDAVVASLMEDYLAISPSPVNEAGHTTHGLSEAELAGLKEITFQREQEAAQTKDSDHTDECAVCLSLFKPQQVN